MKLVMLRRGEVWGDLEGGAEGQLPDHATDLGRRQAKLAAHCLKREKPDILFASDLPSVKDSLREAMVSYPMQPVIFSADLRRRARGIYEAQPVQVYQEAQRQSGLSVMEFTPEGGESLLELKTRTTRFLKKLTKGYMHKRVLACTHGSPIRAILAAVLNLSYEEMLEQAIDKGSLSIVEFSEEGDVMRCAVNSTQHLRA